MKTYGPLPDLSFSGISTFARLPHTKCLENQEQLFDIAIVGAPFDTAVSYRGGARFGPFGIRAGSRRHAPTRGYSIPWAQNPFQLGAKLMDCGDIPISPYDNSLAFEQVEVAFDTLLARPIASEWTRERGATSRFSLDGEEHPRLVTLGGDHSIVYPILRSLNKVYGPVAVIHFDAHIDTWNHRTYVGSLTPQSQIVSPDATMGSAIANDPRSPLSDTRQFLLEGTTNSGTPSQHANKLSRRLLKRVSFRTHPQSTPAFEHAFQMSRICSTTIKWASNC